jgi:ankyrin repeat protein
VAWAVPEQPDASVARLHASAALADLPTLRGEIARSVDVNSSSDRLGRSHRGRTALMAAAYRYTMQCSAGRPRGTARIRSGSIVACAVTRVRWPVCGGLRWHRLASISGQLASIEPLLLGGAEVDARDTAGWTALMCAAASGTADVVRALCRAGADPDAVNDAGTVCSCAQPFLCPSRFP